MKQHYYIVILFAALAALYSCTKDKITVSKDAQVATSLNNDALSFDTLFANMGSVTKSFKIYNPNNRRIILSSIQLAGGNASVFKLNINGYASAAINNIEIAANDSIYVFVQVNVPSNAGNQLIYEKDSIEIQYNSNSKKIQLEAWGANAHIFHDKVINGVETWSNDIPYVLTGSLYIAENARLIIEKGCRIFVHANTVIGVEGSLDVRGTEDERVFFLGVRLDEPYASYPGAWPGIVFSEKSKNNNINYAVMLNSYQALVVDGPSVNSTPKLNISQTIIHNSYDVGILAENSSVNAQNVLISNTRRGVVLHGGNYQFIHCTIASYSNQYNYEANPSPLVNIADSIPGKTETFPVDVVFRNSIIWGKTNDTLPENMVAVNRKGQQAFTAFFDHVLWKQKVIPGNITMRQVIENQNPLFDTINTIANIYSFRLQPGSPAVDKAMVSPVVIDIDGSRRNINIPDLGCYESY